jgi:hypothetical protein
MASRMLRRVALVRTYVSEELSASIIRETRTGELGTTLALTSNCIVFLRSVRQLLVTANVVPSSHILVTLMMVSLCSSETSVLTRGTRRNIPEDAIFTHRDCSSIILHVCTNYFGRVNCLSSNGLLMLQVCMYDCSHDQAPYCWWYPFWWWPEVVQLCRGRPFQCSY